MLRRLGLLLIAPLLIAALAVAAYFFLTKNKESTSPTATETISPSEEQPFVEIAPENDCSNECANYRDDQERYNYCRAVCGFTVEDGVLKPPASTNPELSNDYKLKENAVNEKDIRKCQEIKDKNIKDTCQARVTEDLFEQQGGNGFE